MTEPLPADRLHRACRPADLSFETTEELDPLTDILGQERAVEALRFGVEIRREGYNVFAMGQPGTGKRTLVAQLLDKRAPAEPTPSDWVYVHGFEKDDAPVALELPPGGGRALCERMERLLEDVQAALSEAFDGDAYRQGKAALEEETTGAQQERLEAVKEKAEAEGLALVQTPMGFALAPQGEDGKPMTQEQSEALGDDERQAYEKKAKALEKDFQRIAQEVPRSKREAQKRLNELTRRIAAEAIDEIVAPMKARHAGREKVLAYLDAVREDMIEESRDLVKLFRKEHDPEQAQEEAKIPAALVGADKDAPLLRRYRVNVLQEHEADAGAPVIYEDNPTYLNVIGSVERLPRMGALVTDFNLIRAGALHRANGGYLILDAERLLMRPLVWQGLKRALRAEHVRIEPPEEEVGLMSTVSLQPEPIPLDVKVILCGDRRTHQLLWNLDPDFAELFKVQADFDTEMTWDDGTRDQYARLLTHLIDKDDLRPFHADAVARVVEAAARIAGDAHKVSVHMRRIADLLREADHWAGAGGVEVVRRGHVQTAIEAQVHRVDRVRDKIQEEIARGTLVVDTDGRQVGQVNALAVMAFGDLMFGRPQRVSAQVGVGRGKVVDIEREVDLGEATHSKGVLILSAFLTGRYAKREPLALSASLVFEQSYGPIAGDSASSAELYALLSAIAELPLRQDLAVTGSVSQHGRIQAIGGVNEKIEGFFDTCARAGLTGTQGVLVPEANVQHLMLRRDVVAAVEEERFHVYPIRSADEGIALLTGVRAGRLGEDGEYPPDTVNGRVARRLGELSARMRARPDRWGLDAR